MPWTSKPTSPALDTGHSLYSGLVEFWPFAESSGDAVGIKEGVSLAPQGSAGRSSTSYGLAGACVGTQVGFAATCPTVLKLSLPITLACVVIPSGGTPTTSVSMCGVLREDPVTAPYTSYDLTFGGTSVAGIFTDGGSFNTADLQQNTSYPWSVFSISSPTVFVMALSAAERKLYINNTVAKSNTTTRSSPTYTSTALIRAGFTPGVSRDAKIYMLGFGVWNTYWGSSEVASFVDDPFGVVRGSAAASGIFRPSIFTPSIFQPPGVLQ